MEEPQELGSAVARVLEHSSHPGVRKALTGMLEAHNINVQRRGEVLKHEDLRKRLEKELGYQRADQWNGYIPPATVNEFSTEELCRSGTASVRYNQLGHYGQGEFLNNSPQRAALVQISTEAWARRSA
jgi:hypothetical protein